MLTRRQWIAGSAGALLLSNDAWTEDLLQRLPGKRPLIKRSFRPPNYETPLADLRAPFTANEAFFVRYHLAVIPQVDIRTWRLRVGGASSERPLELSLDDLKRRFEHVSLAAINQCSGNRRGLFTPRVPGVQWENGAMGHALWTGVRLRDVLNKAGVRADALEVVLDGADRALLPSTPDFLKSVPIERALDPNTLIAFAMNGQPLPHWNGAPARLVVPGWTATYWVKHLTDIRVEPQAFDGFWMKSAYRVPAGKFKSAPFPSQETAETVPITQILVNSLVTSHTNGAQIAHGRRTELAGWAWDGGTGIETVEISSDGGRLWQPARLEKEYGPFAWRGFRWPLETSKAGPIQLAVRATSRGGERQPEALTPNPAGYHHNKIQTLAMEVA